MSKPKKTATKGRQKHHAAPVKVAAKARKASMKRAAKPTEPQGPRIVFMPMQQTGGVRVDEDKSLTYSVVWACVRVIAETLGSLSWHVLEQKENGDKERAPFSPVEWILHRQANEEMSAGTFRETLLGHALIWGNGYAEIERDGAGRPMWLWPLAPDRMCVDRDEFGRLVYVYRPSSGGEVVYTAREIFHLKGIGFDGLVGYPVIRMAAQSIGLGLAMETNGSSFFANGSRPGGVLSYPGKTTPQILDETEARWQKVNGGPRNSNRTVAMDQGLEYKPIAVPNTDAQWLEGRQFQTAEVCRWFRVPPHKVADLTRSTNNNIEHQSIEFVQDTILPWAKRLEQEADIKLFSQSRQGRLFTKLNIASLLRGDTQAQAFITQIMMDRGVWSPNDVLKMNDQNGIGPEGDQRFVQANMIPLDMAGQQFQQKQQEQAAGESKPKKRGRTQGDEVSASKATNRINGHGVKR